MPRKWLVGANGAEFKVTGRWCSSQVGSTLNHRLEAVLVRETSQSVDSLLN